MSTTPSPRMDWKEFEQTAPAVIAAMRTLGQAVTDSGLDKALTELVKLRVSQLNGCAFCLQLHLTLARKLGLPPAKLDLLPAWRDTSIYSPRERAALGWAEALTGMNKAHVGDEVYAMLEAHFSSGEIAFLSAAIAQINAWNRMAGALQFTPQL